MFLRQFLTVTILCLAVRADNTDHEIMNTEGYLSKLIQLQMPMVFETACTPAATDLVFALDGSASIHEDYFKKGLALVKASADKLSSLSLLGADDKQTQIGVAQFGEGDYESFPLMGDINDIHDALAGIKYQNSSMSKIATLVDWALTLKDFYGGSKARPSAKKVLVVLTDCLDNCPDTEERTAKANADKAGVEILLVTYTTDRGSACVEAFTGGDQSKVSLWSDVIGDVSKLTGCPPPPPTPPSGQPWTKIVCEHNGTASCHCKPGWTGPTCDTPEDCCFHQVLSDGHYVNASFCNLDHGKCVQDSTGCRCECNKTESAPWTGPTCNKPPGEISRRCIAYENPDYTGSVTWPCDLKYQRCIPDDIDCMFNTAPATDADGNQYCPEKDRSPCDGYCKCKNPEGWCVDLNNHKVLYQALSKALSLNKKYIIPTTSES